MILTKKNFLIIIASVLILIGGFRPLKYFLDTDNYLTMIQNDADIFQQEPTFWIINKFNQIFLGGHEQVFFLLYAILGVSLKMLAIKRYSLYPFFSVYLYICLYYVIFDMTQIRVGVAGGIFLLSLRDLKDRQIGSYLIKVLLATLFHYSAIVMLFIYFLNPKKINRTLYSLIPVIGFFIFTLKDNAFTAILYISQYLPSFLSKKIDQYIEALKHGIFSDFNIMSPYYLSLILIYYVSLLKINKMKSSYDILLIKILGIGILSYSSLSIVPIFATRISTFLYIVLIIFLADFLSIFKQKTIVATIISLWALYYLFLMVKNSTLIFEI